eukprot:scaffold2658_cov51-Phaeocystis_antarctica.AAC.2
MNPLALACLGIARYASPASAGQSANAFSVCFSSPSARKLVPPPGTKAPSSPERGRVPRGQPAQLGCLRRLARAASSCLVFGLGASRLSTSALLSALRVAPGVGDANDELLRHHRDDLVLHAKLGLLRELDGPALGHGFDEVGQIERGVDLALGDEVIGRAPALVELHRDKVPLGVEHEERSVGVAPRVEELVVPVQGAVGHAEREVIRADVEVGLRRRDAREVSILLGELGEVGHQVQLLDGEAVVGRHHGVVTLQVPIDAVEAILKARPRRGLIPLLELIIPLGSRVGRVRVRHVPASDRDHMHGLQPRLLEALD